LRSASQTANRPSGEANHAASWPSNRSISWRTRAFWNASRRSFSQTWEAASPGSTGSPHSGHGSARDWGKEAKGIGHYRRISALLHPSIEGNAHIEYGHFGKRPEVEIRGKNAVVTGGGAGIGQAIAARVAREGASVLVADIDEEAGRRVAEETGATFVAADVTSDEDLEAIAADVDILVNNAGGFTEPVFPDASLEHWSSALDLNLRSAMVATHFAVRAMAKRGGGAIVNVASTAGLGFAPHPSPEYAAGKAGLMRLTASLAPLAERGIRVNCVCPYTVGTAAVRREIAESVAEGRTLPPPLRATLLEPEEVADAVLRLVRDESLAGRVLVLRGGERPRLLPAEE
jgi:NAD(P)-dependent dehydrogenase (short-subunit alcohol dehydrogenase family)